MVTYTILSTKYRKSHRSILSRGRYKRTQRKHPLPTQEQQSHQKRVSSADEYSGNSDIDSGDDLEVDTGADAQDTRVKPVRSKKTKKTKKRTKKPRKQLESEDESEDENSRPSISQNIRKGKTFQRLDGNRVKMAKARASRSGPPPKAHKRKAKDEESDYEDDESDSEDARQLKRLKPSTQTFIKHNPKENAGMKGVIKDVFKEHIFPYYKFMTNNDGMFAIAEKTFEKMSFQNRHLWSPKKEAKERYNFVHDYADYIRAIMLIQRNQCQQNARDWAVKYIQTSTATPALPIPKVMESVAKRQNLVGTGPVLDQNRGYFDLYSDEILPKFTGSQRWGTNKRHWGLLSSHAPENDPQKPYVTVADEAFALVTYEGCHGKWIYMGAQKKAGSAVNKKDDAMENIYINRKAGQAKFGGWTDRGLDRYRELKQAMERARAKPKCKEIEQGSLARLRLKYRVDEKIAEREADPKKKTKEPSAYAKGPGLL